MLFKSKETRKLEAKKISDSHVQHEVQFDAAIEAAGKITDPAERILRLDEIKGDINNQINSENSAIAKEAKSKGKKAGFVTRGSATAAGITAAALLTGPLGWVGVGIVWGGMAAGRVIESKRKESVTKNLVTESNKHTSNMIGQSKRIDELTDTVLENNVKEISQSPLFDQVRALPGVAQKFSDAAVKRIRDEEAAPPAAEAAAEPPVKVKKPAAKKKPKQPEFDLIKKIIK